MVRSPLFRGASDIEEKIARIAAARIAVGASVTATPGLVARIFGAPTEQLTPSARMLGRLFGIRNVVLGVWALSVRDASAAERRRCFTLNAAVDTADLVVLVPNLLRRDLRRTALMSSALATNAILCWLELLEDC